MSHPALFAPWVNNYTGNVRISDVKLSEI